MPKYLLPQIEDYEPLIGRDAVERIRGKARKFKGLRVANFNSTYYGGGVAEMISSLTLLMNSLGLRSEWRVIQGTADFFSITKKMHNALQGGEIDLSSIKKEIYEQVIYENSVRNFLEHDFVIVHDPQPLPLIEHYEKKCPWVWRCHIDLSRPNEEMWKYLRRWIDNYDAVIVSCEEYKHEMKPPQHVFMPAINPFNLKNRELSDQEIDERLAHYKIPTDLPLVVQISRFDPWKDPQGVVEAFKLARKEIDARLVLLGNFATDDPEGAKIFEASRACQEDRILILTSGDDSALGIRCRRAPQSFYKNRSAKDSDSLSPKRCGREPPSLAETWAGFAIKLKMASTAFLFRRLRKRRRGWSGHSRMRNCVKK